jgi:CMP-2-keto-3-deoxyoctulosonic acid synthetase
MPGKRSGIKPDISRKTVFFPRTRGVKKAFFEYISLTTKNQNAMKKILTTMAAVLLFPGAVLAQKISDEDAIKAVIERETTAYFNIDYKNWMDSWNHVPYAYWSYADTSGITYHEGWKAIEIGFTDYFVTSKPSVIEIDRTWEDLRVYRDGAYARFKQTVITDGVQGPEQTEIRVLEKDKKDKQWKIVLVGVLKK